MTRNATTDPDTGLRYYDWMGERYPSVTSVRRLIGMPFPLHNWALSKVIQRSIEQRSDLNAILDRPARPRERVRDKNVRQEAARWLRLASTEERDAAGDRGTRVHAAIETGQPNIVPPDAEAQPYVDQFYAFLAATGTTITHREQQIFNLTAGYAGTLDFLAERKGRVLLGDVKTSSGVYLDHAIQIMAYGMGEFIGADNIIDGPATAALRSVTDMGILHLSPTSWEWVAVQPSEHLYAAFTSMVTVARYLDLMENRIDGAVQYRADSLGQGGFPW